MKSNLQKFFGKISFIPLLNVITIIVLLALPYYLFQGKLYVGGDDTRLFYVYPFQFLRQDAFFTWSYVSSLGYNNPSFHFVPFLLVWSGLAAVIKSKYVLDYFAFSLPFVLGFIYFQKLLVELTSKEDRLECYLGSLFLIFSPILTQNQTSVFLTSVWLIGALPGIFYYFIRYLKTGKFFYVVIAIFFSTIFSIALYTIPWMFGVLVPLFLALAATAFFYKKEEIIYFIRKAVVFFGLLFLSQSFWLVPFVASFLQVSSSSLNGKLLSASVADTFTTTVLDTASGNVLYPMLDLFHRQIAFDYNWQLKSIFLAFYDKIFFINSIFVIIVFAGILLHKKYLKRNQNIWLFGLFAFILSLYFFTVNIGPLKYIFLLFGHVPGFVIFRNFYDKFALGYIFFYALILTLSLSILKKAIAGKYYYPVIIVLFIIILFDALPIKDIVNSPLWLTQSVYRATTISPEYLNFLDKVENQADPTANILGVPFNISVYAVIMDEDGKSAYIGTSPVRLFTGINDMTGNLSFSANVSGQLDADIKNRNYKDFNSLLKKYNINYILVTKNIPSQIKNSYLYDAETLHMQDNKFLHEISGKLLVSSSKNNYELYETKYPTMLFSSKNLTFKKLNDVQYELSFKNLKSSQALVFKQPDNNDWKLFVQRSSQFNCGTIIRRLQQTAECNEGSLWFSPYEFSFLFGSPVFSQSQTLYNGYANSWDIDPNIIKNNFDKKFYDTNPDGSISFNLILYFKPQLYFYIGTVISILIDLCAFSYLFYEKKRYKK